MLCIGIHLYFPILSETYGNVSTEAVASGLACVTYNYSADVEDALLAAMSLDYTNFYAIILNDNDAF